MSKLTTTHELIPVADGVYSIEVFSEKSVSIGLSVRNKGEPTAGTLTFRGKLTGEKLWQPVNISNVIDFASYASVSIDIAPLARLEVTVAGVTGGGVGTELTLAVNRFDYRV